MVSDIAGTKDVMVVLRDIWANYRDESFVVQFLSPRVDAANADVPYPRRSGVLKPASG